MSEVKVSVVMPVYNACAYLADALESVINQSLREIEILCVDDGSTDDSYDILETFAGRDDRIRILQQQNQFAGVARNNGLKQARGKYVIFWDSDDLFEQTALEKLYQEAERTDAQIVVCGANRYDTVLDEVILTNVYLLQERLPENRPFSRTDMGKYIYNFAANVPWNKLYLREFVEENQLRFEARRQANDTYFVMMAFYYATRISVVEETLINYRIATSTSLTDGASKTPLCACESYEVVLKELENREDFQGDFKQSFVNKAMSGFMLSLSVQRNFEAYATVYQYLLEEGFARFGIDQQEKEYFYSEWMYEDYEKMHRMKPEDFLVQKLAGTKDELKVKNSRIRSLRERRDQLKAEREALRARREELKARREELKAERDELKAELKEKNRIIKQQRDVLNSRTVRYALKMKQILTLNGRLSRKK